MENKLRFGPAGMPLACKGKSLVDGIEYAAQEGLNAFEIEWVRGVRLNKEIAREARKRAKEKDVLLSCHAPYWINCCSPLREKQEISFRNLVQAAEAAFLVGVEIVVFHPGYYQDLSKELAFKNAVSLLDKIIKKLEKEKIKVALGPETTGKGSQFGSLSEVLELVKEFSLAKVKPVIDFAHLHARENGIIKTKEDYEKVILEIKKEIGDKALEGLHCHFSSIEFTEKGERRHLQVNKWQPDFRLLAKLLKDRRYKFTIISESPLLDQDALLMQKIVKETK